MLKSLKTIRLSQHLTQSDVAKRVNITSPYYAMIEGNRRRPSPDVAKRIAAVLGFPDEWYRLLEIKADGVSAAEN